MDQTMTTVLMFGALIVGGYFLMIRPQQKKAKQQQEMIAKLGEGDRVMLTSGVLATVRHLGTKQAIVEVSPGVELTILRQAIVRGVSAEEEEFEYSDEAAPDDLQGLDGLESPQPAADDKAWQPDEQASPEAPSDPVEPTEPSDPPSPSDHGTERR